MSYMNVFMNKVKIRKKYVRDVYLLHNPRLWKVFILANISSDAFKFQKISFT